MKIKNYQIKGLLPRHNIKISRKDYNSLKLFLEKKSRILNTVIILEPNDFKYGIVKIIEHGIEKFYLMFYENKDKHLNNQLWKHEFQIMFPKEVFVNVPKQTESTEKVVSSVGENEILDG